ncbi:MAG: hypothetical protein KAR20_25220, partial [Candidatus Heimdallarchaeota archaeon]|nr:hypothetical protein [Candidatus Heimdallarchaeota archaeon]
LCRSGMALPFALWSAEMGIVSCSCLLKDGVSACADFLLFVYNIFNGSNNFKILLPMLRIEAGHLCS